MFFVTFLVTLSPTWPAGSCLYASIEELHNQSLIFALDFNSYSEFSKKKLDGWLEDTGI
jgi:hypothetical protein